MNEVMTVRFWGVRGSHPVPGPGTIHYGGNTACVEIKVHGQTLILDAGTGIIGLGQELASQLNAPLEATLLFTHLHHDHTQGLPFFKPAYIPTARLHIFGPGLSDQIIEGFISATMAPPVFPVSLEETGAAKDIHCLQDGDLITLNSYTGSIRLQKTSELTIARDAVRIKVLRSYAHPGGVLCYRVEWGKASVVYATDIEGYVGGDHRLAAFARGANVLIHDAQYSSEHYRGDRPGFTTTQGFGHSTAEMACEVALAAGVKQLMLLHYDPNYDDAEIARLEKRAASLFSNTTAAYEGLTLALDYALDSDRAAKLDLRALKPDRPTGSDNSWQSREAP